MRQKPRCIVWATLACLLVISGVAAAQDDDRPARGPGMRVGGPLGHPPGPGFGPPGAGPGPERGMGMPPREVMESLNLTDAQRAKLHELRDAERRKTIRIEADLRLAEMDLEDLLETERPTAAAIDAATRRIGDLRLALLKSRIAMRLGLRSILTAEQRTKMRGMARPR